MSKIILECHEAVRVKQNAYRTKMVTKYARIHDERQLNVMLAQVSQESMKLSQKHTEIITEEIVIRERIKALKRGFNKQIKLW